MTYTLDVYFFSLLIPNYKKSPRASQAFSGLRWWLLSSRTWFPAFIDHLEKPQTPNIAELGAGVSDCLLPTHPLLWWTGTRNGGDQWECPEGQESWTEPTAEWLPTQSVSTHLRCCCSAHTDPVATEEEAWWASSKSSPICPALRASLHSFKYSLTADSSGSRDLGQWQASKSLYCGVGLG